jgi:hypothetical protein
VIFVQYDAAGKLLDVHRPSPIIATVGSNGETNLAAILTRPFPFKLHPLPTLADDRMFPKHIDAGRASMIRDWNGVILSPALCKTGRPWNWDVNGI